MKTRFLLALSLISVSYAQCMEMHLTRDSSFRHNLLLGVQDPAVSFLMVSHSRLGAASPARIIDKYVMRLIVTEAILKEWIKRNSDEVEEWENKQQHDKDHALRSNCVDGNIDKVRILLYAGANLAAADKEFGFAAWHWAAFKGHTNIVKFFWAIGANPGMKIDSGEHKGFTAADLARKNNKIELADFIEKLSA